MTTKNSARTGTQTRQEEIFPGILRRQTVRFGKPVITIHHSERITVGEFEPFKLFRETYPLISGELSAFVKTHGANCIPTHSVDDPFNLEFLMTDGKNRNSQPNHAEGIRVGFSIVPMSLARCHNYGEVYIAGGPVHEKRMAELHQALPNLATKIQNIIRDRSAISLRG